uniref:Uncharacterized protein n=1 Tax=Meloidogyne enterolobii TaxID=390850 RepID=A0A6V7TLU0_MELEN|nr:unnamed protein product [Meloidogyne enterolobii]
MKIENFELKIEKPQNLDNENYVYLAGEEIKGKINIYNREKTRIVRLSLRTVGSVYTGWQYANAEYESKENILDMYNDLTGNLSNYCDETMELNCGEFNLEFSVKIPKNAISSYYEESYGNVKYSIVATLDIVEDCGESEIVSESEFLVRSFLSLDSPHFLNPAYSTEEIVTDRVCLCFGNSKEKRKITIKSPSLGLLPGETSNLILIAEQTARKPNKNSQIKWVKLSICQQVDFVACRKDTPNTWDKRSVTRAIQNYNNSNINCQILSESEQQIQFQIPKNLPPTSAKENDLINFSYFFRIEIEQNLDIILPIVIGSFRTIL